MNEVVTADRTSHPAAKGLSAETIGRIRKLLAELSKEESVLVDAIHQSLDVPSRQRLDDEVQGLYAAALANVVPPKLRPVPLTRAFSGTAIGASVGASPDLQIYDPGGPSACNGLDPEEEAELEASCDLYGGNYTNCVCIGEYGEGGGGGGGDGNPDDPTPADNTPIITGIDPSVWISGSTTSVTFKGQYFGTNSPNLAFSPGAGIGYTLTINNRTVPWIWSVIEFNSSNVPTYSQVGMFPSYTVYSNGNFVITYPQSTVASFILNNNTYQLTPSQIP